MCRDWRNWVGVVLMAGLMACQHSGEPVSAAQRVSAAATTAAPALGEAMDLREQQAAWQQLDATRQSRLREAAQAFATLPEAERQRLRQEFEAQEPLVREGWLLGPDLGAAWPHLSPLFEYVPEEQRDAVLACLQGLSPQGLDALERIAWRTPESERETLRAQLLALPATQRDAWLIDRAER